MKRHTLTILATLFSSTTLAQGIDRRPHPDGGIYGPIVRPAPVVHQPLDTGHAGYGGSAPTPEQLRSRAARSGWESITGVRSRMSRGSTWPARFVSGNEGFLATVAWELGHPRNASAFQNAWGRSDRGVNVRFNYNGNDVQLFIPGTDLSRAVDALWAASNGQSGGYRFYEPPHVPPQIGAPRTQPLMLRLFGPENGSGSGMFWTALGLLNTVNPNASVSPDSGWIGRPPMSPRSSLAPIQPNGASAVAVIDGMSPGGSNVAMGDETRGGVITAGGAAPPQGAIGAGMLRL